MFSITGGKGFRMTFKNGCTISVQWGPGNCCSSKVGESFWNTKAIDIFLQSENVEVAIWDENDKYITSKFTNGNNDTAGYCSVDEVLDLMNQVQNY